MFTTVQTIGLRSLVGAGVDVLAIRSVLHQRHVIVSGECEVRHAAHQASNVLSVCVQSYFLHAPWSRAGETSTHKTEGDKSRTSLVYELLLAPLTNI